MTDTETRRTLLARKPERPLIAPSVLSADFGHMARDAAEALDAGVDLLHLDVMDGHFAPNLTMGPDTCAALRRALPEACLDVHLMVTEPQNFFERFAKAGADHQTFHAEVAGTTAPSMAELIGQVKALGCSVGVAINPATEAAAVEPVLDEIDMVLVMSVVPGFSGQAFIPEVLDKVRRIAPMLRPDQRLEMDGGIAPDTAAACRKAGADVFVAGSAYFGQPAEDRSKTLEKLRG